MLKNDNHIRNLRPCHFSGRHSVTIRKVVKEMMCERRTKSIFSKNCHTAVVYDI
ncbi:hypothetical protein FQR65_LT03544 [Abscondita terminalis]|nr:hypothetical protein FQR65_LT03544 [Abscondita terminalis]